MNPADGQSLKPFFLIGLLLSVPPGVIILQQRLSIWSAPVLLLASLIGIAAVLLQMVREARQKAGRGTGVQHDKLAALDIAPMLPWLKQNLRGHDGIVDAIAADLQRNLQLSKPGRHLGGFLLVGPTGTGKTFLASLIGNALYRDREPVVLRMNQYKHPNDVFTLLGPPPGMPGYEVGGTLTRPVLEDPHRVVILDELEKAHPDIHHCLYDVLDVAMCREKSSGRLVDFSACTFFATSNAGVEALRRLRERKISPAEWLGGSRDALADAAGFDKAFLARWNGIYLMDELPPLHVAEVACLQLAKYWREYGMEVAFTAPQIILDAVLRNEEFRQYGVRQLGAFIQGVTGEAIAQARGQGARRVRLEVDPARRLVVQVAEAGSR